MQRSRKPPGHGGIRALVRIGALVAVIGVLLGLTSCLDPGCVIGDSRHGYEHRYETTVVAATAQSTEPSPTSVTVAAATASSEVSSPSSVAQSQAEKERIFECSSDAGGHPGAKIPEFTMDKPRVIVEIMTYHWDYNDHVLGTIALTNVDTGVTYGPWETVGGTGQGGVENAYWLAHPNVEIPAGTYKLVDSSPSTWFTNDEMGGFGGSYVDALK